MHRIEQIARYIHARACSGRCFLLLLDIDGDRPLLVKGKQAANRLGRADAAEIIFPAQDSLKDERAEPGIVGTGYAGRQEHIDIPRTAETRRDFARFQLTRAFLLAAAATDATDGGDIHPLCGGAAQRLEQNGMERYFFRPADRQHGRLLFEDGSAERWTRFFSHAAAFRPWLGASAMSAGFGVGRIGRGTSGASGK
ncbi:hypothetical protein ASC96_14860 [Rhizobium sp. Root1204]|nr:hypothetical protein ASC96_14860 [Rhizobium sp. Root1204]